MAQSSAPLQQSPPGKSDEGGVNNYNVNLIKNESPLDGDHPHNKGNGAAIIEPNNTNSSGSIPLQKINKSVMVDNNHPPSLQSSADDGDAAIMEDAATTSSGKPSSSSSGEVAHVERTNINNSSTDTAAVRSDAAATTAPSNNNGRMPINPLATNTTPNLQSPSAVGGDITDARQQQILASIQHRRQLLAWVRESRIACEQSRSNISNGTKKGFVAALVEEHAKEKGGDGKNTTLKLDAAKPPSSSLSTVGGTTSTPPPPSSTTSAEEIANYKKVSKLANSATALQRKKSNSTITTAETAAQRELRRGSSVGKRMSAAVTTLNNFGNVGGWASTDTSVSGGDNVATSLSSGGGAKKASSNHVSSSSTAAATNNGKLLPNKAAAFPPSVGKQLNHPTTVQSSSTSSTLSSKAAPEKLSKKARKRSSGIKKTGVGSSAADGSSSNHVGGTAVSKNASAVKQSTDKSTQYMTLSANAIRLRDRRDELALKLSNLLLQKQHHVGSGEKKRKAAAADVDDETSPFTPRKKKDVKTKTTQSSSLTKLSSLSEMGKTKEATRLPPRRMTQWDCVLEEMRWMASDFIQERKWKVACGKSLSSCVKQQHIDGQKSASAKSAKGKLKHTPSKSDDVSATAVETPSSSLSKPTSSTKSTTKSADSKSSDRRKMPISDSNPLYVDPSNDDVEHSRKISQLLSLTISDHWDVTSNKGAFPLTDDDYKAGYERFRKVRGELLGETSEISVKSSANDSSSPSPLTFQELEFDDISKKMQESVTAINSLKAKTDEALSKERALQKYRKSLTCGVELSNAQLKAVHFIESIWASREEMSVAAVLGGNVGIGKTIVGCSTLWKNRHAGAQLVLCSPASLFRWKHELNKFDDLNVKVFGHGGWSFRADDIECTAAGSSDVFLCDYSSFIEMADGKKESPAHKSIPDFASLILDCRHPSVDDGKSGKHPVEIESAEWWNRVVQFMMSSASMDRVVIEHPWNQFCPVDSYDGDKEALDCKMIAMKLAFMCNPATFFSTRGSVGKRVISWAKRQDGFDGQSPPLVMLRSVLAASVRKMYDSALTYIESDEQCPDTISVGNGNGAGTPNVSNLSWEIRKCSLAASQQIEYDQYCSNNLLSLFPSESTRAEIADTLLMLRKICFHATMGEATTTLLDPLLRIHGNQKCSVDGSMIARKSTQMSEACFTTAKSLLEKSSKMKELLHILARECGHEVPNELIQTSQKDLDPNTTSKKKAKVIILATLSEAQLMTSYFLSAVGLHHEVLVSLQTKGSPSPATDASVWAWSQSVISQFNDGCFTEENHPNRFFDILVASPITLSSHGCGVGAASADFVISIDEDWSGREELHVASLLSKLRASEKGSATCPKPPCKFVKIVSKSTCEDTFICKGNTVRVDATIPEPAGTKVRSAKKTRKRGRSNSKKSLDEVEAAIVAPRNIEYQVCLGPSSLSQTNTAINDDGFLLPAVMNEVLNTSVVGSKILRHRSSSISDVFGTQLGSDEQFMPKDDEDELTSACSADQCKFSLALYQSEHKALHSSAPNAMLRSITLSKSCAPHSEIHPRDVLSNRDVSSAPVRCFAASLSSSTLPTLTERRQKIQLFQSGKSDPSATKEETTLVSAQNRESCEEAEIEAEVVDSSTFLVYELPTDKLSESDTIESKKRKMAVANEDLTTNAFSSFFDLSDTSMGLACDGHEGLDASVYAPSFLPPLLDIVQSTVVEATTIPQDNGIASSATKPHVDETSMKLFTDTSTISQQDAFSSMAYARTKLNDTTSAQTKISADLHSFETETNPYSFPVQSNSENLDTMLCNSLAGCVVTGAISCQSWPSLNAMILLKEKKKDNALGEQDKKAKKAKNHLSSKPSTVGDKLSLPYFRKEKIMRRASSASKKVKFDDAASIVGSVRLRSRLNDLVIGSSQLPPLSKNTFAVHDSGNRNKRSFSGINLPIGVKEPAISSKLSSSLEETPEPWTEKEDILLKETLARYGLNWQLASKAISAAFNCMRSPSQCRHRWESLSDSEHSMPVNSINVDHPNDVKTIMRFNSKPDSNENESLIYIEPSHIRDLKNGSGSTQMAASHWIGNLSSSTNPGAGVKKEEHIASRIAKLRDTAKRRRFVPITLPGATTAGTEITVRLAPIHASHAEAVHAARSDMSQPRKEMWPLELLDYVEKQRKVVAEQGAHDPQRGPTSNHIQPTSQPPHHQPYPPQPPAHPTQQQHHATSYHPAYDPYRPHQQPHEKPSSTKGPP